MNYQVKVLDRSTGGRYLKSTLFHYETCANALIHAMALVNEPVSMRIVLILDPKGHVIFNKGFHTEGGVQ